MKPTTVNILLPYKRFVNSFCSEIPLSFGGGCKKDGLTSLGFCKVGEEGEGQQVGAASGAQAF